MYIGNIFQAPQKTDKDEDDIEALVFILFLFFNVEYTRMNFYIVAFCPYHNIIAII